MDDPFPMKRSSMPIEGVKVRLVNDIDVHRDSTTAHQKHRLPLQKMPESKFGHLTSPVRLLLSYSTVTRLPGLTN